MVVIDVRAVNPAAEARLAYPVQLAVGRNSLQQREGGQRRTVRDENESQLPGLRAADQSLSGKKAQHGVRAVQQRLRNCVVRVSAAAENKLHKNQKRERRHGKEQRVPANVDLAVEPLFAEPKKCEEGGTDFQNEDRPRFDRANATGPNMRRAKVP